MAVAETALSHTKGGCSGESTGPSRRTMSSQDAVPPASSGPPALLALAAAFAMGAVVTLAPDAAAQVHADTSAPKQQQPTVVTSANGTVQVNIQTPSAAGVSRNSYSQFDVDKRGVILNNSRTDVGTQLGGFVQGNPWLAKGGARVILNEVNSSAPSRLKGYVEVAGQRAEVIIANPAGIQVDGGGFINASAAVLTTGLPRFNVDGSIAGYGVQGGLIRVDGQGLDGSQTDYTALLARAVELNAGLWAKDARIQTGTQVMTVDAAGTGSGEALAPMGERPRYALDSTALGGIYAQRITLVGTEAGLGVRQAGQIVGGQLTLRSDGWLDNTGTVYAQESDANGSPALTVQSSEGVRNAGWLASRGSADVRAPQVNGEAGSVLAAGMTPDGALAGGGSLSLTASQSVKQAGQVLAADHLAVQAPTIDLGGAQLSAGATMRLSADGLLSTHAASLTAGALSIAAHDVDLRGAQWLQLGAEALTLNFNGAMTADGARIASNGSALAISASAFSAMGASLEHYGSGTFSIATGPLSMNGAQLVSNGLFRIDATQAVLDGADVLAPTISWRADGLSHRGALTRVAGVAGSTITAAGGFDNTQGRIESNSEAMTVRAATIDNRLGVLSTSGASLQLEAGSLQNRGGLLLSSGRLDAGVERRVAAVDNTGGQISARDLTLNADLVVGDGTVYARGEARIAAGRIETAGVFVAGGALAVSGESLALQGSATQAATASFTARSAGLDLGGASLTTTGALTLETAAQLVTDQAQVTGGQVTVRAADWRNAGGEVVQAGSAGAMALKVDGRIDNTGGRIGANGTALDIEASSLGNTNGRIAHAGSSNSALTIAAGALTNAGSGLIASTGRLAVRAGSLDNSAQLQSQGVMSLDVAGAFVNSGAAQGLGDVDVRTDRLTQTAGGTIAAQRHLTVQAAAIDSAGTFAAGLSADGSAAGTGDLSLRSRGAFRQSGSLFATGALSADAATLDLSASKLQAASVAVSATGGDLLLAGAQASTSGALALTGAGRIDTSRATLSGSDVSLTARHWDNVGGVVAQLGTAGQLMAAIAEGIGNAQGLISAQGRAGLTATGGLSNSGTIHAQGEAAITVGSLTQTMTGIVAAQGGLAVNAGSVASAGTLAAGLKADNTLASGGDLRLDVGGTLQQSGQLLAAGTLSATAAQLQLDDSHAQATNATLIANGIPAASGLTGLRRAVWSVRDALSITATGAMTSDGAAIEAGSIGVTAGSWSNQAGRWLQTASTGAFSATVSGRLDNRQGDLGANGTAFSVTADRLDNGTGRMTQTGGTLDVRVRQLDGAQGRVLAAGALTLNATGAMALDGATTQGATVRVDAVSLSHRNGQLLSGADAVLRIGDDLDQRDGRMQAAGTLDIAAAGLDNTGGQLSSNVVTLRADRLDNGAQGVINATGAAGALTVDANRVTNAGTIQSVGNAVLAVADAFDNTGMVYSQGGAFLSADQLINNGTMAAQGSLSAATGQLSGHGVFAAGLRPDNTFSASEDLSLGATRSLQFGGTATVAGDLRVTAPSLQLQDVQLQSRTMTLRASAGDLSLDRAAISAAQRLEMAATGRLVTSSAQVSANDVQLTARDWFNVGGRVTQMASAGALQVSLGGNLDNRTGTIESNGAQFTLSAGTVDNTSGRIAQAGGDLAMRAAQWQGGQGQVLASGALDWQVAGALTANGATTQADSVRVVAGSVVHDGAQMVAAQGVTLDVDGLLSNRGGSVVAGAGLAVEAGQLTNAAGGVMQAGGALQARVTAGALDNQGGRLRSGGDMTIEAIGLHNRGGWAGSDGQLTMRASGAVQNQQGTLLAQRAVAVEGTSLVNQGGRIASAQGGVTVTTAGLLDNTQGAMLAAGGLALTSTGLVNQAGELSGTAVHVDARGQSMDNRGGRVLSTDTMTVRSGALNNHGGLLQSMGAMSVDTAGATLTNTFDAAIATPTGIRSQGSLQIGAGAVDSGAGIAGNAVTVNAASLTNRNAISGQTVTLGIAGALDNQGGQVIGAQRTAVTAGQVLNQGGLLYGGQSLDVTTGGVLDNRATSGTNLGLQGGAVTARAGSLDNRGGQLRADGDLSIVASQMLDNGGGVLSALGQTLIGDGGADARASALDLRNGSGRVWGGSGVAVSAAGLSGGGEIASGGALSLTLGGSLTHGPGTLLQARGDMALTLGGDFINQGVLRAGGALSVDARNIDNQASGELSSADTRLTAVDTLTNRGLIDGDRVRIDAGQVFNLGSGRIYGSDLTIAGGTLTNGAEGGQSAVIASRGALTVSMSGGVSNTAQSLIYADGDLSLRAASLLNENARIEASRLLQMDVADGVMNRSVYDGAENLPQDPSAPRVLDSKAFISSGGDMRLTAGQVVNSGATIETRGDLLLQSADIQNLNPYLKWALVGGQSTNTWKFQAPGSTTRYKPEDIRVLWAVTFYNGSWSSEWGSPAQNSLEPFVYEFHPKEWHSSKDTYNRKMLLPSVRYPNEIYGRYLGGLGGDADGSAARGFDVKASGDHPYRDCTTDGCIDTAITGAHYAADDRIWSDFGVTPGDDAGLDAALQAFYNDTNSRLVGDFTAFDITRTVESAKVTQSSAGQIIVGGRLKVEGGRVVNRMSRVIGRDGVDIRSTDIDNRTVEVAVKGTEHVDVYTTWNGGSGVPNRRADYTSTDAEFNETAKLDLPTLGVGGAMSGAAPGVRQQAGAVNGSSGAQAQQSGSSGTVNAGAAGSTGSLAGAVRQAVNGSGAVSTERASAGWRAGGHQQAVTIDVEGASNTAVDADLRVRHAAQTGEEVVGGAVVRTDVRAQLVSAEGVRQQALPSDVNGLGRVTPGGFGSARVIAGMDASGRLRAVPVSLTLPSNSLFKLRSDPQSGYLVETDPRFANYRDWLSSDYLLQAMSVDPAMAQKRLGDGFYEQRLVREQIGKLTGSTFLQGYADDEAMYRALLGNGASFGQAHQLRPGVALTAEQMALLTTDLVWLVEQEVTLADGTVQRVLVPQVYLLPRDGDLQGTGALIAGNRVELALSGTLNNSGDLRADALSATAQGIVNTGSVRGTSLALSAREDLRNIGGELTALESMSLKAGRDLVVSSTTASGTTATSHRTVLEQVAKLTSGGVMVLQAGQDVLLEAAQVRQTGSEGGVLVQAGRDLKLSAVRTASSDHAKFDDRNYINRSQSRDVGASVQADGAVILKAGQDLSATAAHIASDKGSVTLSAGRDVSLLAGQSTEGLDQKTYRVAKSTFSKTTTSTYDKVDEKGVIGTSLSGDTVTVLAGQDVRLQAAQLSSEGATTLDAGRDLLLQSAEQSRDSTHFKQSVKQASGLGKAVGGALLLTGSPLDAVVGASLLTIKSGSNTQTQSVVEAVGSSISAGSIVAQAGRDASLQGATVVADGDVFLRAERNLSVGTAQGTQEGSSSSSSRKSGMIGSFLQPAVGTVKQSSTSDNHAVTQTGSQLASLGGNVTLQAGERYTQTGSQVLAQKAADGSGGDVDILAKSVRIEAALNSTDSTQTSKFSKTALGGSVSVPLVSAVQSAIGAAEAGSKTGDKRMQALAGLSAALASKDALDAGQALMSGQGAGIKVGVSLGTSKSQSSTTEQSTTAGGSQVAGQGDVRIRATGGGQDSTLHVVGSDIKANGKASLKADGAIQLEAAQSTDTLRSTNSSSGASIGVSYAFGGTQNGFTIEATANKGKGRADGTSVTQVLTHVSGSQVQIDSGGDTTLKGAVVQGAKVTGSIGGNLNIESLQDITTYDAKQQSAGVGVSLCIPPLCYGMSSVSASVSSAKAKGNFASVAEQSGIVAGDEGFRLSVKGNTDLKGGVITSSQQAVDEKKNSLATATLTQSEVQNHDSYKASGYSVGVSLSTKAGDQPSAKTEEEKRGDWKSSTKPGFSPGIGSVSGSQGSTTLSGISGAEITITDEAKQKELTGKDAAAAVAELNRDVVTGKDTSGALKKSWDGQALMSEVQAQVQITQQALPRIANEIGAQMGNMARQLRAQGREEEARKYDEGGAYRVAAHAVLGALGGGLAGAAGAGVSAAAVPKIDDVVKGLGLSEEAEKLVVAAAGTVVGAVAGGGTGAAMAGNQVVNNYLNHARPSKTSMRLSEKERYEAAAADCGQGDQNACKRAADLALLSRQRDLELQGACGPSGNVAKCEFLKQDAKGTGNLVINDDGFVYARSQEAGNIRLLDPSFAKPYEPTKAVHEWQSQIGTPALSMLSGNVGVVVRGVLMVEGGYQMGIGVQQVRNGDAIEGALNLLGGAANAGGAISAEFLAATKAPFKRPSLEESFRKSAGNGNSILTDDMLPDADFSNRPSGKNELTPIKNSFGNSPHVQTLSEHLAEVGSTHPKRGISGGHSEVEFNKGIQQLGGRETDPPVEIAPGISVRTYTTPQRELEGLGPLTKTTYDSRWTDQQIEQLSLRASQKVWTDVISNNRPVPTVPTRITIDRVPFLVYFSKNQNGTFSMYAHPGK